MPVIVNVQAYLPLSCCKYPRHTAQHAPSTSTVNFFGGNYNFFWPETNIHNNGSLVFYVLCLNSSKM